MKILNNNGKHALVLYEGKYYVASDNGYETLIFTSNKEGKITNWSEVGGGSGLSLEHVLDNFSVYLKHI